MGEESQEVAGHRAKTETLVTKPVITSVTSPPPLCVCKEPGRRRGGLWAVRLGGPRHEGPASGMISQIPAPAPPPAPLSVLLHSPQDSEHCKGLSLPWPGAQLVGASLRTPESCVDL